MTDLEAAARQIEAAARAFGSTGPELEFFEAWGVAFRALAEERRATAAIQQALDARVDALTAPTDQMRREWRQAAHSALQNAVRDWMMEWRRWRWLGVLALGVALGAAGVWGASRGGGVCASPPVAVTGGVACWVRTTQ